MSDDNTGKKIGKYVKYQRDKRGWSLQEFATRSKLTPSYISKLESGNYTTVKYTVLEQLAGGFEIPLLEFLRKCEVTEERRIILPDIDFYLREKYQFPTEAVEDVRLFLEFVQKKYLKGITLMKTKHKQYWDNRQ